MSKYLVISRCEDSPRVHLFNADDLEGAFDPGGAFEGFAFLSTVPDIECFPSQSVFIFKGDVVVPKQVSVVTKYEL